LGQWLNIFSFTGLPGGDFMVLTPFQIHSGGSCGTVLLARWVRQ
jgi:hypothetical protein